MRERGQSLKSRESRFPRCRLRRNLRRRPRLLSLLLHLLLRVAPKRQLNARTLWVPWLAPGSLSPFHAGGGGLWASLVFSCLVLGDSCCGVESVCPPTRALRSNRLDKGRRLRQRFLRK